MRKMLLKMVLSIGAGLMAVAPQAWAADRVNVGSAHKGFWDMTIVAFGKDAGIFKKHDIDLNILWTDGGADTIQAIVSGSIDIAVGNGTLGVLGAYSKGAPIELLSSTMTGASDLFWYVKGSTPIKSFEHPDIKTAAFSKPGASTHLIVEALVREAKRDIKLVPAGGPSAALTQVMSGQIDVGWAAVPFGIDRTDSGEIRIIATGNDVPGVKEQSVRVTIANRNFLQAHPGIVKRFMAAYKETIDWAYNSDAALMTWAEMVGIDPRVAKRARDFGYPHEALQLFPVRGIESSMKEAVQYGRLAKPMTAEAIKTFLAPSIKMEADLNG